jgi:hypothetical protein
MKTAISIPNEVFEGAERLARRTKEEVTEVKDRACSEGQYSKGKFVSSAARRVLERTEW